MKNNLAAISKRSNQSTRVNYEIRLECII